MSALQLVFGISFLVLIDQVLKFLAIKNTSFVVNGNYILGIFSVGQLVATCIIFIFVLIWGWLDWKNIRQYVWSLAFILASLFSNLIDRFYSHGAVDYLFFQVMSYKIFFNLADLYFIWGLIDYGTRKIKKI